MAEQRRDVLKSERSRYGGRAITTTRIKRMSNNMSLHPKTFEYLRPNEQQWDQPKPGLAPKLVPEVAPETEVRP
jgi:hypothetical protein